MTDPVGSSPIREVPTPEPVTPAPQPSGPPIVPTFTPLIPMEKLNPTRVTIREYEKKMEGIIAEHFTTLGKLRRGMFKLLSHLHYLGSSRLEQSAKHDESAYLALRTEFATLRADNKWPDGQVDAYFLHQPGLDGNWFPVWAIQNKQHAVLNATAKECLREHRVLLPLMRQLAEKVSPEQLGQTLSQAPDFHTELKAALTPVAILQVLQSCRQEPDLYGKMAALLEKIDSVNFFYATAQHGEGDTLWHAHATQNPRLLAALLEHAPEASQKALECAWVTSAARATPENPLSLLLLRGDRESVALVMSHASKIAPEAIKAGQKRESLDKSILKAAEEGYHSFFDWLKKDRAVIKELLWNRKEPPSKAALEEGYPLVARDILPGGPITDLALSYPPDLLQSVIATLFDSASDPESLDKLLEEALFLYNAPTLLEACHKVPAGSYDDEKARVTEKLTPLLEDYRQRNPERAV